MRFNSLWSWSRFNRNRWNSLQPPKQENPKISTVHAMMMDTREELGKASCSIGHHNESDSIATDERRCDHRNKKTENLNCPWNHNGRETRKGKCKRLNCTHRIQRAKLDNQPTKEDQTHWPDGVPSWYEVAFWMTAVGRGVFPWKCSSPLFGTRIQRSLRAGHDPKALHYDRGASRRIGRLLWTAHVPESCEPSNSYLLTSRMECTCSRAITKGSAWSPASLQDAWFPTFSKIQGNRMMQCGWWRENDKKGRARSALYWFLCAALREISRMKCGEESDRALGSECLSGSIGNDVRNH